MSEFALVTSTEMRDAEKKAFEAGYSDREFMDEVARAITHHLLKLNLTKVIVVAGKGNNGGDAVLVANFLHRKNIDVEVFHLFALESCSPLLKEHLSHFINSGGKSHHLQNAQDLPDFENAIILDGILGSGFSGKVEGVVKDTIERLNTLASKIYAIDIPSGLDGNEGESGCCVLAFATYFLNNPKWGFFLNQGFEAVGKLIPISFSLEKRFLPEDVFGYLLTKDSLRPLLPPIKRVRHKYDAGLVCALCNSFEMSGASALASIAALRSGAGYLRYLYPQAIESKLQVAEEVVKLPFKTISDIEKASEKANAFLVGPGFPTDTKSCDLLKQIFQKIKVPLVLDGGALYHLATKKLEIPKHAILTPHTGEMSRFISLNNPLKLSDLLACQEFANTHQITLVLKGAPTFIFHPHTPIYISPFGHPAMATMGTGDVLTGVIAAFVAQGLEPLNAAKLAVGLHGLAGEIAAQDLGSYSVIASDLVEYLPEAFLELGE